VLLLVLMSMCVMVFDLCVVLRMCIWKLISCNWCSLGYVDDSVLCSVWLRVFIGLFFLLVVIIW